MEWGKVLTLRPVTVSMTTDGLPYFGCRATNELDQHSESPTSINFLGMLRWALREPVNFYEIYCRAWFYKKTILVRGGDGYSGKGFAARQKVLAEVFCLILSVSQQCCVSAHCS